MTTEISDLTKTVDSVNYDFLFFLCRKCTANRSVTDENKYDKKTNKYIYTRFFNRNSRNTKCFRKRKQYTPNVFLYHLKKWSQYSIEKEKHSRLMKKIAVSSLKTPPGFLDTFHKTITTRLAILKKKRFWFPL